MDISKLGNALNAAKKIMDKGDNYRPSQHNSPQYSAPKQLQELSVQPSGKLNSNLPREIIESMLNNPIDPAMSTLNPGYSILDSTGVAKMIDQTPTKVLTQEVVQPSYQGNGNIDYSIIKMIVKEVLNEQINSLTENRLSGIKIVDKQKMQLLTTNGDLFEGNLKFIKNTKRK